MATMLFSERFNDITKLYKITDKAAAEAAGTTVSDIKAWHTGEAIPTMEEFFRFCMARDLTADYMLGMDDNKLHGYITYSDIKILKQAPTGYNANLQYMMLLMEQRHKDLEKRHELDKAGKISAFDKASLLPSDMREEIIALIRLERQMYEERTLMEKCGGFDYDVFDKGDELEDGEGIDDIEDIFGDDNDVEFAEMDA